VYTRTTLRIRSSTRKSSFSNSFFGRLKAVTVIMRVSFPYLSYYTSSYVHIGPCRNVPSVSNLRLLTSEAWVQSQSIQCGSFVEQGDSGSPFVPIALRTPVLVIVPPVNHLLSSSSSGTITVGPFYYGIPLRTSSLVLRLITLKHHFVIVKSNVHSRTGHESPERSRGIEVLLYSFFILTVGGSGWSAPQSGCFTPGNDPVPIL